MMVFTAMVPEVPIVWKVIIMPNTVPSNPIYGALAATVPMMTSRFVSPSPGAIVMFERRGAYGLSQKHGAHRGGLQVLYCSVKVPLILLITLVV
mgnify:CR=1 FL=1